MKTKTLISPSLIIFVFLMPFNLHLRAEGIASMTTVKRENATKLEHHRLDLVLKSQRGKSYIEIEIRPIEEGGFGNCSVTVYDKKGEKILLQFDPKIGQASKREGLSKGTRVYFHIADDLVDSLEIRYHISANEFRSHVYTIPRGQVTKIANLR